MKFLVLLLVWIKIQLGAGFAEWMMTDFCDRGLALGEVIMNEAVVLSAERTIKVYRNDDQEVLSGEEYYPGEKLQIVLSSIENQFLIETSGGKIYGGGCHGKRQAGKGRVMWTLPTGDDAVEVSAYAGWAEGHSQVKMTQPVVLIPNLSGDSPPVKEKTISVSQDKFNKMYRRGYVSGEAKIVPDTVKDVPPPAEPRDEDAAPRVRGNYNPPVPKRRNSESSEGEEKETESNLRGKALSADHIDSTEGTAPKEGRTEPRRIANVAPDLARVKGGDAAHPHPRYRKFLEAKEQTEEEKEAAANFSHIGHALTFNEMEFVAIVGILLIFVLSLLWQMYTGRYQLPSIFRFWNKRPGGRYNN